MKSSLRPRLEAYLSKLPLIATLLATVLASGLVDSTVIADELTEPSRTDRRVSLLVSQLMQTNHLSNHPLDDSRSIRAFDNYIDNLRRLEGLFSEV